MKQDAIEGRVEKEKVIFHGTPSQAVNTNTYAFCLIVFIAAMLAPSIWNNYLYYPQYEQYRGLYQFAFKVLFFASVIYAFVAWMKVHNHKYTLTTERLKEEDGVFSKHTDELELFRVKDISNSQPFFLRVFSCGNIIIETSDKSTPIVVMTAIKDPKTVIDLMRANVQIMRTRKGVREIDH